MTLLPVFFTLKRTLPDGRLVAAETSHVVVGGVTVMRVAGAVAGRVVVGAGGQRGEAAPAVAVGRERDGQRCGRESRGGPSR